MGDALQILGQDLDRTSATLLFTASGAIGTVLSTIAICNRTSGQLVFYVAIVKGGGAPANQHYIYYGVPIQANDTFCATLGMSLASGDQVYWNGNLAGLSITATGVVSS
jgi:hypothetical protein